MLRNVVQKQKVRILKCILGSLSSLFLFVSILVKPENLAQDVINLYVCLGVRKESKKSRLNRFSVVN